jgi:hypothetical protein
MIIFQIFLQYFYIKTPVPLACQIHPHAYGLLEVDPFGQQMPRAPGGSSPVNADGIVLVGVEPANEGTLLRFQAAPARSQEIAVPGAILLQEPTGPIRPKDMGHPNGVVAVIQVGRITGPPEFVKHLVSMTQGNASQVPRCDVDIRSLATAFAQFSALRAETKLHLGFHKGCNN